ncbi:MAG: exodeoxyribonuclease VII small subunit [Clostridia bacterium]|nr:exodeoxyribonuclease VII small subunit [Clostridia bacterium]
MSFEEAFSQLEDIVKKLEGGGLSLDESLEAFEKAVKLVKLCNEKIEKAEAKVKILVEGADGSVTDAPFDVTDAT